MYMSRHGSAEKSARLLKKKVKGQVELINLKTDKVPDLDKFDTVIMGGSIHGGQIQDKIKRFCKRNMGILLTKRLGLYLCCMKKGEEAQRQFIDAYPDPLRNHAEVKGIFGGEFMFDKMNFLERMIVRKAAQVTKNISTINQEVIDHFAENFCLSADDESMVTGI
jgi:menaquinone-dependent protoporphyrinogen oxidase